MNPPRYETAIDWETLSYSDTVSRTNTGRLMKERRPHVKDCKQFRPNGSNPANDSGTDSKQLTKLLL